MKYLKLFGLAAVAAAAFMAFVGAGTASAETTLCEDEATTKCLKAGDEIVAHGITTPEKTNGTNYAHINKPTLTGGFEPITCNSTISGKIDTATTPTGTVKKENLTWTECEGGSATTVTDGTIGVHHDASEPEGKEKDGTVTIKGFVVKIVQGVTCYYGGELKGTLTGSDTSPVIHVTTTVSKIDNETHNSSFFCPSSPVWHATYTSTTPLTVHTGV